MFDLSHRWGSALSFPRKKGSCLPREMVFTHTHTHTHIPPPRSIYGLRGVGCAWGGGKGAHPNSIFSPPVPRLPLSTLKDHLHGGLAAFRGGKGPSVFIYGGGEASH